MDQSQSWQIQLEGHLAQTMRQSVRLESFQRDTEYVNDRFIIKCHTIGREM